MQRRNGGARNRRVRDDCPVLKLIRKERGTASKIADMLKISRAAVWRWKRVPAERVIDVEMITKIPRQAIRPDLYP